MQSARSSDVTDASLIGSQPALHTALGGVKAKRSDCGPSDVATFIVNWYAFCHPPVVACPNFEPQSKHPRPWSTHDAKGEGKPRYSASHRQQQRQQETTGVIGTSASTSVTASQPTAPTQTSAVTVSAKCYNRHETATSLWHGGTARKRSLAMHKPPPLVKAHYR